MYKYIHNRQTTADTQVQLLIVLMSGHMTHLVTAIHLPRHDDGVCIHPGADHRTETSAGVHRSQTVGTDATRG